MDRKTMTQMIANMIEQAEQAEQTVRSIERKLAILYGELEEEEDD